MKPIRVVRFEQLELEARVDGGDGDVAANSRLWPVLDCTYIRIITYKCASTYLMPMHCREPFPNGIKYLSSLG